MIKKNFILLTLIIVLGGILRFFQLSEVPPSLSWDEAAVGYDAWLISQDGKDQWGQNFPPAFKSFGEYKYPFHIYASALSVKFLGLSDFAVRFPSALFGVVNILMLFLVVYQLFGNKYLALSSALFLSISPWHIQFSRVAWETNFALFFFLTGLLFFLKGVLGKIKCILLAALFFVFAFYSYNAAKIFIPLFALLLIVIFRKELYKKNLIFLGVLLLVIFLGVNLLIPQLSGLTRLSQVGLDDQKIYQSTLFRLTNNFYLGRMEASASQYLLHLSPKFLFLSGDSNPRHSIQMVGELYWLDLFFLSLGIVALWKTKTKASSLLVLGWFFLGPVPGSLFSEAPHASRAMFSLGSWQIVSAVGFIQMIDFIKKQKIIKPSILFMGMSLLILVSVTYYLYIYFTIYPKTYSQDWQYGYKQIFLGYKDKLDDFDQVLITDRYNQPYIFSLYYLRYDPEKFRQEVKYNPENKWSVSTVANFGKFSFENINFYHFPKGRSLIFAHPSERLTEISPKNIIYNLDGTAAMYVYEYSNYE